MKSVKFNPLTSLVMAAALAIGLSACGGGGAEKSDAELEAERLAAAEAACESAGGRWESDNTCTSADDREMEAAQMACEGAGGRYEADGSCTSAADLETERLAAAEAACTAASGRWESDNTCTSAAELVTEAAQMACTGAGGRWNADHTCTSAADVAAEMERERLAGLAMTCTDAGGRWNADNTCTDAAGLEMERLAGLAMACTDAGGRWNADNTCTDSAGLETERMMAAATACTDAGGRWNADNTCTDAAGLEMERMAAAEAACNGAGGRYESDGSCTSAAMLIAEAAEAACTSAGGRYEADGSCTSAAGLEMERLAGLEAACTGAGGRWNDDNTCTSRAAVLAEVAQANCLAGGGRYEADGSCTSASALEMERLAGLQAACEGDGGRWNDDNTCTNAAGLEMERLAGLEMACTDDGGRWNDDNTCTNAAGLEMERLAGLEMDCTGEGGRWNDDNTCTDAAELEAERLDASQMACIDAGGRWNGDTADDMCSDVTELAAEQRMDINTKLMAAQTAVNAVNDDSEEAVVTAADDAVEAARTAIADAANIEASEKAAFSSAVAAYQSTLDTRKSSRMTAMEEEERTDTAMDVATALKLHAGIAAQDGNAATTAAGTALSVGERAAAYNDAGVPSGETPAAVVDTRIMVGIGDATAVALSEDKKTMVGDNHGWEGKRYTAEPGGDGMYEAVVYSNVGEPTMGKKFGSTAAVTADGDYQYRLNSDGYLSSDGSAAHAINTTDAAIQMLVDSSMFDQSAGTKTFDLPANSVALMIAGSYHGVPGMYSCTPTDANTKCSSSVAADGFMLGGGTWSFKPSNPNAMVESMPDAIYASYGWWIHKSEDDKTYTASAFVDVKGGVDATSGLPPAAALDSLNGTATYMGGAAGKYALSSALGGINDAGHFTARARLDADFSDNSITGTVDQFKVGDDGESRDWSVELKEAAIAATGGIARADENDTVWTRDGTAADASGEWSGTLYDNDEGGVPKVGTGTFDSMFGRDGKMVGAFGVNQQ